jgi:uncharacterized protein
MSMQCIDKIVLGTVQLGMDYGINNTSGKPDAEEAMKILTTAYESGIRTLDTAEAYGSSQEVIGTFHKSTSLGRFSVITKYNGSCVQDVQDFKSHVLNTLQLLNVDCLEAYLFHNYEVYTKFSCWEAIHELVSKKKIKKLGVSVYTNEQAMAVAQDHRVHLVQLPFNLLDNFSLRGDILRAIKNNGKELHVRSVFLQGLFYKERSALGALSPLKETLLRLDNLAKEESVDIGTLALAYSLRQPYIDKVLIGVETESQLIQNIRMAKASLSVNESILTTIDHLQVQSPELLNPSNWS